MAMPCDGRAQVAWPTFDQALVMKDIKKNKTQLAIQSVSSVQHVARTQPSLSCRPFPGCVRQQTTFSKGLKIILFLQFLDSKSVDYLKHHNNLLLLAGVKIQGGFIFKPVKVQQMPNFLLLYLGFDLINILQIKRLVHVTKYITGKFVFE